MMRDGELVIMWEFNILIGASPYMIFSLNDYTLTSVKRIIKYVSGTLYYGLWYSYDIFLLIIGYFEID